MQTSLNDLKNAWSMDCKHLYIRGLKKTLFMERFNKQKRPDPWAVEAVFNYVDMELDRDGRNVGTYLYNEITHESNRNPTRGIP